MTIFLIIALCLMIILYIISYTKNTSFKKDVNEKLKKLSSPLRKGYFKYTLSHIINEKKFPFDVLIYVNEIERYDSGDSKTKFLDVEIIDKPNSINKSDVVSFITDKYTSLKKTDSIIWLEEFTSIEEDRKNKLERIKELINRKKNKRV